MKKLAELTGFELAGVLAETAPAVGNLVADEEFWKKFQECTLRGTQLQRTGGTMQFILSAYAELVPLLLGEKHVGDVMQILAAVEGVPVKKVMAKNGFELIADVKEIFTEQLLPFFTKSAPTEPSE